MARTVAAIVGGYAISAMAAALMAGALPWSRIEATMVAGMASFALYATIACWAFGTRHTARFCTVLTVAGVLLAVLLHWQGAGIDRP